MAAVYRKTFNNNFSYDMEKLQEFLQEDIDKVCKINLDKINRLKEDISIIEMKQGLRALRLRASGGPDGMTARLLNYIAKFLPNLVLGAMQEVFNFHKQAEFK